MAPGAALSLLSTWAEQIAQQPWEKWLLPSCWSQGLSWVPWHMAAQLRAGHSHRVKKCDLCCSCHYCLHGIIITESTCSKVVAFTVTQQLTERRSTSLLCQPDPQRTTALGWFSYKDSHQFSCSAFHCALVCWKLARAEGTSFKLCNFCPHWQLLPVLGIHQKLGFAI